MIIKRRQAQARTEAHRGARAPITISKMALNTMAHLNSIINRQSPKLAEFLARTWTYQQHAITYQELRDAVMSGYLDLDDLYRWQEDYSEFVVNDYAPIAEDTIIQAAADLSAIYFDTLVDPMMDNIKQFIDTRGGKLIREVSQAQYKAVNVLVKQAAATGGRTVDELARAIRPCVGLTARMSQATYNFYDRLRNDGYSHKQALKRQAVYAEKMHRYRASMIAQTELAYAYNAGADMTIRQAQAQGLAGSCKKKWSTALDERVCKECKPLDGVIVDMDMPFPNGCMKPPAHPLCRCTIIYEIDDGPKAPADDEITIQYDDAMRMLEEWYSQHP